MPISSAPGTFEENNGILDLSPFTPELTDKYKIELILQTCKYKNYKGSLTLSELYKLAETLIFFISDLSYNDILPVIDFRHDELF